MVVLTITVAGVLLYALGVGAGAYRARWGVWLWPNLLAAVVVLTTAMVAAR
jgi:hypothetical protein